MKKTVLIISWPARIIAALIMLQTLYFKFTAAPESVYIFSQVGMEPWGRIGAGLGELIASVLLLIPATVWMGAGVAAGLMAGALFFHMTSLGVEVMDDGGQLFVYALTVFFCSLLLLWLHRDGMKNFLQHLVLKKAK